MSTTCSALNSASTSTPPSSSLAHCGQSSKNGSPSPPPLIASSSPSSSSPSSSSFSSSSSSPSSPSSSPSVFVRSTVTVAKKYSDSVPSLNMNVLSSAATASITPNPAETMLLRPKSEPIPTSSSSSSSISLSSTSSPLLANRSSAHPSISSRSSDHDSRPSSTHSACASTVHDSTPIRSRSPSPLNLATQSNNATALPSSHSSSTSVSSLSPGASSVTTGAASTGASAASIPTTTSGSSIGSNVLGSQLLSHSVSALQAQLNAATAISGATLSSSAVKSGDNRGTPIIHQKPTFGVNAAGPSSIVGVSLLGNVPISTVLTAHSGSLSANISATESSTNDPISLHNETLSGQSLMMYKWPQHGEQLVANIAQLIHEQQIVDVTLACDGQSLKAHKLVLSAGSSYFRELFAANPCKHPIVILKDIAAPELRLILHFMYRGELKVSHEQLPSLLKTAQLLQVRGLLETLKQRLIDDSINLSSVNASLRSLDSNSRPDCVVVSGHDSGFFSNPSIAAAIHKSGQSNGSSAPSVFGSSALGSVPVSTFGHIGASLAGLSGAFPTTNSLPFSSALNGPAALLAAELGPARYAAAALDLAALSQCRNGLSALDVCASDPDAANVPDHASNLLAAGSSLLLPTAFRNDLLQQQSRSAASGTTTAGTSHHLSVNDSYLGNAITNAANTDELLDELLCRSRKRRRGQPLSGLLRVGKPPFSASPSPGTFGRLSTGSMGNLSGSLPFASLNAIRGAESTLVNEAAGSVGSVLRARSTGANASSNTNGEVTCNETALSLVTSNRRSMSDLSHVSNVHDLSETNGCAAGSTGSTGSSGASSSSGSSSRNSSCPSQSGVTPAMLAATGLVASSAIAAATASNGSSTNRLGKDSSALDSDGGQACSDDESADVNALKNMRQLMHQAAAALSKQQTGALLALQRSSTPDNGSLIGRRSNRHSFPALDQLPENSENNWLQNGQIGDTAGADDDDNDELIDMRPIVSFDEGSNMVSTMATSDQINDINQQLLNSMSAGRSQPQSGKVCVCPLCNLTFTAFSSLRRHMQRHYADRERYECDICLKSYSRKDYLKEHKKLKHSNLVSGYGK